MTTRCHCMRASASLRDCDWLIPWLCILVPLDLPVFFIRAQTTCTARRSRTPLAVRRGSTAPIEREAGNSPARSAKSTEFPQRLAIGIQAHIHSASPCGLRSVGCMCVVLCDGCAQAETEPTVGYRNSYGRGMWTRPEDLRNKEKLQRERERDRERGAGGKP